VQDGQDGPVPCRIEEIGRVPGGGKRAGLGLPVTDHAGDDEVRVVESDSEGMRQAVAQLATLVQGAGGLGRAVAADVAREGELRQSGLAVSSSRLVSRAHGGGPARFQAQLIMSAGWG
jgi:hypothetical protein